MYDVDPNDLIEELAKELKNIDSIKPPEWAQFVRTGVHKERPPARDDWWYIRAAAVLRSVARLGPIGVAKLRTKYGGKKNRGNKMAHFYKGSGNIIRKILQQLEKAELLKKEEKKIRRGRLVAPKGVSLLSKCAKKISTYKPKEEPKVEEKPAKRKITKEKPNTKPEEKKEAKPKQEKKTEKPKEEAKTPKTEEPKVEEKKEEKSKEEKKPEPPVKEEVKKEKPKEQKNG